MNMNMVFLGPPGAGKGTYAKELVRILEIPHISTGDMFREAVASGSELGKKVEEILKKGDLVPDDLTISIVKERLSHEDCKKGFILDGFPRTVDQAKALDEILTSLGRELGYAVYFEVSEDIVVKRITNRRICKKCGKIYNLITLPPKIDGKCDICGGELYQREDDREEVVRNRYKVYMNNTYPVIEYYQKQNKLFTIDGASGVDSVIKEVLNIIRR
ncbi:Adenylate kinase [Thermosipho atlanticus DSM 15807]|uniref:Adenylate kinase n=2 Tax=Thermosipho TaxID=2420 RepID=A0A1M5TGK3_9BACT|nr:Adenylate kinase [Thermosipho atlanticus DSM 15807]